MNHELNYSVSGLSCGSCVDAISKKLTALGGVEDVRIDLVSGGLSKVVVTGLESIDDAGIREAIDDAGFDVVDVAVEVAVAVNVSTAVSS